MLEVAARLCALTGLCVQNAEVAPAVCVLCIESQCVLLLDDCRLKIATRGEQLREERVAGGVCRIGRDSGMQCGFGFFGMMRLLIGKG